MRKRYAVSENQNKTAQYATPPMVEKHCDLLSNPFGGNVLKLQTGTRDASTRGTWLEKYTENRKYGGGYAASLALDLDHALERIPCFVWHLGSDVVERRK